MMLNNGSMPLHHLESSLEPQYDSAHSNQIVTGQSRYIQKSEPCGTEIANFST